MAVKAYREGKLPFPDGAIIATVHSYVPSAENNKVFGRSAAVLSSCAPCHAKASQDFVFAHYAP